jgi:hypothetical protein
MLGRNSRTDPDLTREEIGQLTDLIFDALTGEDRAKYKRQWRAANLEQRRAHDRAYSLAHRSEKAAHALAYRQRNLETLRAQHRAYRARQKAEAEAIKETRLAEIDAQAAERGWL